MGSDTMEELIICIARALVNYPEAVTVTKIQKADIEVYRLHVAPEDMGKVIGKQGKIARAIRLVVKAAAVRADVKVAVDIV